MFFYAFGRRWSIWVLLTALIIVLLMALLVFGLFMLSRSTQNNQGIPTAAFSVITAPTSTPFALPGLDASATPTQTGLVVGGIGVGMYVQITGTEGDGLRLRSGPGTGNSPRFLGRDSEVFKVRDGPKDADGYTWWYLVTPYDETRSGWAAANYLTVVAEPTPQNN